MIRGFGIDAGVPLEVAADIAKRVEELGYGSFWVNGSPHEGALAIIEMALGQTDLDVGVGVFPLPQISAERLVGEVRERELPQSRLHLGVGSNRRPGALADVREAADLFRKELNVTVATGAVGPKMLTLAGEVADEVTLTWSFAAEVEQARPIVEDAASRANREAPGFVSFIRCALMPQAAEAIADRVEFYDQIPHYRAVFERHGLSAADTVVTGSNREELLVGIEREEAVLDSSVIRAIPAEDTVDSIVELVEACAP